MDRQDIDSFANSSRLTDDAAHLGLRLNQAQCQQFETYYQTLIQWNERLNLNRITSREDVLQKHFLDSLSCYFRMCLWSTSDL